MQLDPRKYIADIKDTEKKVLALKVILENAVFAGKDYENFVQREQKIKVCLLFPLFECCRIISRVVLLKLEDAGVRHDNVL